MKLQEFTEDLQNTATLYNGIIRTSDTYNEVYSIIDGVEKWKKEEDVLLNKIPYHATFPEILRITMDEFGFSERTLAEATTLNHSTIRRFLSGEVKEYKPENILTIGLVMGLSNRYISAMFRAAGLVPYSSTNVPRFIYKDILYGYFMENYKYRGNLDYINSVIYCFNLTESGKEEPVPYLPNNKTYLTHMKKKLNELNEDGKNPLEALLESYFGDMKKEKDKYISRIKGNLKEDK